MKPSGAQTIARLIAFCLLAALAWAAFIFQKNRDYDFIRPLAIGFGAAWITLGAIKYVIYAIGWHGFRRRKFTEWAVKELRTSGFPMREFSHDSFSSYLSGIENDLDDNPLAFSQQLRRSWLRLHLEYTTAEKEGAIHESRVHQALNDALDIYSPAEESPDFVSGYTVHWLSQAQESEIRSLPHASGAAGDAIIDHKPFRSPLELFQLLLRKGLPRAKAMEILNAASEAADEWNEKRL
jgi:hypothetical protein